MQKRTLAVGLIGYQFMGRAHSNAYRQVGRFFDLPVSVRMKTICGRNEEAVKEAAEKLGWEDYDTDWRLVVEDPEIDIIDVSTPGDSHCEIAVAAAKAGKAVFCEKPLANTLEQAEEMLRAVQSAGVPNAIFHNYRKSPAVALAKQLIDEGRLGTIHHVRAVYLQDWIADPNFPLVWRLQKEKAGSGAHGDINAHIIDLARFLVGEFSEVCGMLHTFVKQRPLSPIPQSGLKEPALSGAEGSLREGLGGGSPALDSEMGEVTVDDAAAFLARFQNGAIGTFEATRFAVGRKNYNCIEINGSKGSLVFNQERMNELEFYDNSEAAETAGFRAIQATEGTHPYAGHYWPPGHIIGYEHTFINLIADALMSIAEGRPISPGFEDGYQNQRVLDAVERSAQARTWIAL